MARAKRTPKQRSLFEPSELQIHIAVVQRLRLLARKGVIWYHCPNGGLRDKREAAKLKAMGTTPGIPDLIILADGKTYGLELKTIDGRLSHEQRQMLEAFEMAGAFTAVAHGIDAAISILTSWGILPPSANTLKSHAVTSGPAHATP
jgi:hypothetical protein